MHRVHVHTKTKILFLKLGLQRDAHADCNRNSISDQILSESLQQFQPQPSFLLPLNRRLGMTTLESLPQVDAEGKETLVMVANPTREVEELDVGYHSR